MSLNGVIAAFATGTYTVIRSAEGTYVEGFLEQPVELEADVVGILPGFDSILAPDHGAATGDGPVRLLTTGTLPGGVDAVTRYWLIRVDANTLRLALSPEDAAAGTFVSMTDGGTGVLSFSSRRFQAVMSVQPITGRVLDSQPEGESTSERKIAYVVEELRTRVRGFEPDVVLVGADRYYVVAVQRWDHWGETHHVVTLEREDAA